jgi:WD40 repeat protein
VAESLPDRVIVRDLTSGRTAYTLADPEKVKRIVPEAGRTRNHAVAFTPNGKHLLTNDGGFRVQVWEAATGTWVRHFTGPEKVADIPKGVTFRYDVADLVACQQEGLLFVRVGSGYCFRIDPADWSWHYAGQLHGDLAAVSGDSRVAAVTFDADALADQCEIGPLDRSWGVTVTLPDGAWYAALTADGKRAAVVGPRLKLVTLPDGETVPLDGGDRPLKGYVRRVEFSPDGKTLFVASEGHPAVARWDAATGKRLADLPAARDGVAWFALTADGTRLVQVGGDGAIRRFTLPAGEELPPSARP